jgi:uncharacterized membrane protein
MYGAEASPLTHLFRWTLGGGTKDLATLGAGGVVAGVNGDGTAAVGAYHATLADAWHPFRWTASGFVRLSEDPGMVNAISLDGTTIIGTADQRGAFRYANSSGYAYLSLGTLTSVSALAVNSNGTIVGGSSSEGPWIWDATAGVRMVIDVLTGYGVDMSRWGSVTIHGMSADGTVIVGHGYDGPNYTCWIARL